MTCWKRMVLATVSMGVLAVNALASEGWTITSDSNCKVFNPNIEPSDSASWSGTCTAGYASGSGTLQWYSNSIPSGKYEGEMKGGVNSNCKCTTESL